MILTKNEPFMNKSWSRGLNVPGNAENGVIKEEVQYFC